MADDTTTETTVVDQSTFKRGLINQLTAKATIDNTAEFSLSQLVFGNGVAIAGGYCLGRFVIRKSLKASNPSYQTWVEKAKQAKSSTSASSAN